MKIESWEKHWVEMPDFYPPTRDTKLRNSIDVSDVVANSNKKTDFFPKYPIYIVSKGRWDNQQTAKSLQKMGLPFKVVVESDEYEKYCHEIGENNVLMLPFSNLGQGSIPARNWIWEHSISHSDKHWILDDNINGFGIQKGGRRINVKCGDMFRQCEDFVDRYSNIGLSGIRYRFHHNYVKSPYYLNTRIYSCILIDNKLPHRWRGKYNEDTDLSLRVLKDGLCTMLFIWCFCNKAGTMTIKGGNTDNVYKDTNERLEYVESLIQQHPDLVKLVRRFDRWHHQVDYSKFKENNLLKK